MEKKLVAVVALAGLTLGGTLAYGVDYTADGQGIVGSKHDMNKLPDAGVTQDGQGRVCAFCHTPHHKLADGNLTYNPLWSHTISNELGWKMYQSVTFDGYAKKADDPLVGPSRLCMSCHDGIIAVDQHYGTTYAGTASNAKLSGDGFLQIAVGYDKDLSNDHPIGFDLKGLGGPSGTDPGIRDQLRTTNQKLVNKTVVDMGFKDGDKSWMTCASCHDVHNRDNTDTAFLYDKQAGSAFCLMFGS